MSGAVSAGAPPSATPEMLALPVAAWLQRAHEVIAASAEVLNQLNVFPISDSDTGTNVQLTLRGILDSLPESGPVALDDLTSAAVLSAHGNSGAILAEMLVSVGRRSGRSDLDRRAGAALAQLLRAAAGAATRAVARPVAGTVLTVADDAARAAESAADDHPDDARAVLDATRRAAADSLARTPELLEVLAQAGVVDAGGQAYVLLLDVLAELLGGEQAQPLTRADASGWTEIRPPDTELATSEYEVMYALRGASPDALDALRDELSAGGNSVVVVGDQSVAQVHVHLTDAGAAVEAGLARGVLSQLRITVLPAAETPAAEREVIAVVAGAGLAQAVTDLGGTPVLPSGAHVTLDELSAVLDAACGDVVILPNDMESLELASHLAASRRGPGRRVAVIPTTAQVQGLAALAVHEPSADFDSAVVTMSATAGHARHGAVTVAEGPAMTMAGRCDVGDVLGLVDGDFVEIGTSVLEVAQLVVGRLAVGGGELLTLIVGAAAEPELAEQLRRRVSDSGLEIEVVDGGQRRYPLLMGIE